MSGFVAVVHLDDAPVEAEQVKRLLSYLRLRARDAEGIWVRDHVGLGHALFHTTEDTPALPQPCSLDGKVWVAGDIRIDDRARLIAQLQAGGCAVTASTPDAELILWAYHVWSEECVQHLLGDFAFVLWDGTRRRLWCARDHFGIKPFYYSRLGQTLIVSNSVDCIRGYPGMSDELNEAALGDFFLVGYNHELTTTTFAEIQRLPPAHTLICAPDEWRVTRYWTCPTDGHIRYKRAGEYVEHFRELFNAAVGDRLRAAHVGVTMSGGLDSTSVAAVAQRQLSERGAPFDLHAHTITQDQSLPDQEGYYARIVAQALGMSIQFLAAEPYHLFQQWEEPGYCPPEPVNEPLAAISRDQLRGAAKSSRVLLSGLGGDPLFMPAPSYLIDALRSFEWGRLAKDVGGYALAHRRLPPLYLRSTIIGRGTRYAPRAPYPTWMEQAFASRLQLQARWRQITSLSPSDHSHGEAYQYLTSPFWQAVFFERSDPQFTGEPVQMRYPFFDVRLVNYVFAIPPMPWCSAKELLRQAMRGSLPEPVRARPKTPLAVNPIRARLANASPTWQKVLDNTTEINEYVDRARLLEVIRALGTKDSGGTLLMDFRPVSLAYWLRARSCQSHSPLEESIMEAENKDSVQQPRPEDQPKKEYHSPEVVDYGDVRELTQTNPLVFTTFDGTFEVTAS